MFRALVCPSSGVCDYVFELPHWLYCSATMEKLALAEPHPNCNTQRSNVCTISDKQHQRTLAAHYITYPIMLSHHTQENIMSNMQKITKVKINSHALLDTTKQQNISHTTNTKITLMLTSPSLQNNTANVVDQTHSRKLLKMDISIPETCWVSKK